jgi:hypothetical protein
LRVRWPRPTRNTWLTFWLWPSRPNQIREDDFGLSFMIFIFWISRICNLDNHVNYIYIILYPMQNYHEISKIQKSQKSLILSDDNPSYLPWYSHDIVPCCFRVRWSSCPATAWRWARRSTPWPSW